MATVQKLGKLDLDLASDYYVDAVHGNDMFSGLSAQRPFATLKELADRMHGVVVNFPITIHLLTDIEEESVSFDCEIVGNGSITIQGIRTQVGDIATLSGFIAYDTATGQKQIISDSGTDFDGYVGNLIAVQYAESDNQTSYLFDTHDNDGYCAPFYLSDGTILDPTAEQDYKMYAQTSMLCKLVLDVKGVFYLKDVVLEDSVKPLEVLSGDVRMITCRLEGVDEARSVVHSADSKLSFHGSWLSNGAIDVKKGGTLDLFASIQSGGIGTVPVCTAFGKGSLIEVSGMSIGWGDSRPDANLIADAGEIKLSAPYGVYDQSYGIVLLPGSFAKLNEVLFGTGITEIGVVIHAGSTVSYELDMQPTVITPTKPVSVAGTSKAFSDFTNSAGFSTTTLGAGMFPNVAVV